MCLKVVIYNNLLWVIDSGGNVECLGNWYRFLLNLDEMIERGIKL